MRAHDEVQIDRARKNEPGFDFGNGSSVITNVPIRDGADEAIFAEGEKVPMGVDCVQRKVAGRVGENAREEKNDGWMVQDQTA